MQGHRVQQPVNDDNYIIIELEFPASDQAERFLGFLQKNVWSSSESAPALVGTPQTRILQVVDCTSY